MDMAKKEQFAKEVKAPYLTETQPDTSVNVIYEDKELVNTLLGLPGQSVLKKVIKLIYDVKRKGNWPLISLEIDHTTDIEDRDWQYVLVNLVFDTDFESADEYLHQFYGKLDQLSSGFSKQDQDILQRMIYLDVKTSLPINCT
jgi:hypothetical protein